MKNRNASHFRESIQNHRPNPILLLILAGIIVLILSFRNPGHGDMLQLDIDDTVLLETLRKIDHFSYLPSQGNMGDALLASSTMDWFDRNHLHWKRVELKEQPDCLVYGGGGTWIDKYITQRLMQERIRLLNNAQKVVLLPSSFNNVPDLINILDDRFTVFCREQRSYQYLKSSHTNATIHLDHDMASRLSPKILRKKTKCPSELKSRVRNLTNIINQLSPTVSLFRQDRESLVSHPTDLDLSLFFGDFTSFETREKYDFFAQLMIKTLGHFQTVLTDRLHIGMAAGILGLEVELYDNSYGKVGGVYYHTLAKLKNIHFHESV